MQFANFFARNFEEIRTRLLVSCPKSPNSDGGLFIIDFSLGNISKLLSADCRGIAQGKQKIFVGTNSHGILELDPDLNVIKRHTVPSADIHGLRLDSNEMLYIAETKSNTVSIYETKPFKKIDEIRISEIEDDYNHINDIWVENNTLWVSMFSWNGGWRKIKGDYDGAIAQYSLADKQVINLVNTDL